MADVKKPRASWDEDQRWSPPITVYEEAVEPIDTGLLGPDGVKLFRRPESLRIGFDLTKGGR
jgi:hypothetical protein